jgi:signal transduction histidine kinase/DNA-binding response OmpR family regulator
MPNQILVVDDEPDVESLVTQKLRRQIREKRFEFFFARNGEEALETLARHSNIELVLTDINMPVMDGLTLLSRLNAAGGMRKAVIVSAYGDMSNIRTAMNRGAADFLVKPIDFEDFETTVSRVLAQIEQLKTAAENREKLQQVEQELNITARIVLLGEIGREITSSLDLDSILLKLYAGVGRIVDAGRFAVGFYRSQLNLIEFSLALQNGQVCVPYVCDTNDKNQFAVWCIDNRKPVLLGDAATEYQKFFPAIRPGQGFLGDAETPVSLICLPLVAQDRVLGVLSIQSDVKNAYTEQHLRLLENLASYTTIAIENSTAYRLMHAREQEVREQAAELATINRISQALSTQLDMERLIQLVGDEVRDLFLAPITYVALLDRESKTLRFPYAFGEDPQPRPFGEGLISQIIRSGQPVLIKPDAAAGIARTGEEQPVRDTATYLGVPIFAGREAIGVISVQTTEEVNRFNESDQHMLSTIASAVGVAIHNARLFEEARVAQEHAEQADAAKSSFLSTVSHELRTPLTSVLGFAKIIRRRLDERLFPLIPEDNPKIATTKRQVVENLQVVISEGERLTKLLNDVLDLAKIEAGKFTWNMAEMAVAGTIERALAATASLYEAKKLKVVRNIEPGLPNIAGDEDRLIQVVINLISNAVKFTNDGSVTCSARRGHREIIVSVADSGIGIRREDQPKVFERFKQVGDTLTGKPQGTGLGLPICKEIVEHHGGRIWVESEVMKGSTFSFSLPVTGPPSGLLDSKIRQPHKAKYRERPRSVLVIDDDPAIRSLLQQEFTEAGYAVRLAEDGGRGLALMHEEAPGLVVLDLMMAKMNGFDVTAAMKGDPKTKDIPIIILSIVEDQERGLSLGVDRYLTKPIDTVALFREVGTLLGDGQPPRKVSLF